MKRTWPAGDIRKPGARTIGLPFVSIWLRGEVQSSNIVADLASVLATYRPTQIFTTAEVDPNPDHATTYRVLRLAIDQVRATSPFYTPVIHKTIVSCTQQSIWPTAVDPSAFHTAIAGLTDTPLRWEERASLDVPLEMQDLNLLVNPKYRAIQAHASQAGPQSFIGRFAHKDEIFWSENPSGAISRPLQRPAPTSLASLARLHS